MIRLKLVGCQPRDSRTVERAQVMAESTVRDQYSSAYTSGWEPSKRHDIIWDTMTQGEVEYLELVLEQVGIHDTPMMLELEDQPPIVGRLVEIPQITHRTANTWSARIVIEEDF